MYGRWHASILCVFGKYQGVNTTEGVEVDATCRVFPQIGQDHRCIPTGQSSHLRTDTFLLCMIWLRLSGGSRVNLHGLGLASWVGAALYEQILQHSIS